MQSRSMAIPIGKTNNNDNKKNGKLSITASPPDFDAGYGEERQGLMSKSLGNVPQIHSFLTRRSSEVSDITYSGYLWKRSNRPLKTVNPFPMDSLDCDTNGSNGIYKIENNNNNNNYNNNSNNNMFIITNNGNNGNNNNMINSMNMNNACNNSMSSSILLERSPLLQPKPHSIEDSLVGAGARSGREGRGTDLATPPDSSYQPKQPLHVGLTHGDNTCEEPSVSTPETNTQQFESPSSAIPSSSWPIRNAPSIATDLTTPTNQGNFLQPALDFAASFFGLTLEGANEDTEEVEEIRPSFSDTTALATNVFNSAPVQSVNDGITSTTYTASSCVPSHPLPSLPKSTPIKMASATTTKEPFSHDINRISVRSNDTDFEHALHKRVSAPCILQDSFDGHTPSSCDSNPPNILDPDDGHIWRAKYCILQDGILYFYRNATDAKSAEAIQERQRAAEETASIDGDDLMDEPLSSSFHASKTSFGAINKDANGGRRGIYDLSKSPMPTRHTIFGNEVDPSSVNSSSSRIVMWEKRVALNCVGSVRSAESEYGKNSFELLAVEDEDGQGDEDELQESIGRYQEHNKLVLRAGDQDEMNEWLFQFHCSLASFVRNVMDLCVASTKRSYLGDLHHSVFQEPASTTKSSTSATTALTRSSSTSLKSASFSPFNPYQVPFSPRFLFKSNTPPAESSLSHGHGRVTMHRRRVALRTKSFDTSSPPQVAAPSLSPLQFPMTTSTNTTTTSNLPTFRGIPLPQDSAQQQENERMHVSNNGETAAVASVTGVGMTPELSAPLSSCPPETERPLPKPKGKYIPPFMRRKQAAEGGETAGAVQPKKKYIPPHMRKDREKKVGAGSSSSSEVSYVPRHVRGQNNGTNLIPPIEAASASFQQSTDKDMRPLATLERVVLPIDEAPNNENKETSHKPKDTEDFFRLGGCADPRVVTGSILDDRFIPRKASKVGPVQTEPLGISGGGSGLRWEVGAVSECGIRSSNEDSYLVSNNLIELMKGIDEEEHISWWNQFNETHPPAIFAVFDGHCGDQAARYAAERLHHYLHQESQQNLNKCKMLDNDDSELSLLQSTLRQALSKLDMDFCKFCVEGNREWESGSTALVAMLANERVIIANIGDCRGVISRTIRVSNENSSATSATSATSPCNSVGWNELPTSSETTGTAGNVAYFSNSHRYRCLWKEVAEVHSPSREDERKRIAEANGWTTTEKEIPVGQLKRMDFLDEDVIEILKRCFYDRINSDCATNRALPQRILQISRVCGELAVSRAIGDRDFKAAHNCSTSDASDDTVSTAWDCPLFLVYPQDHTRQFVGDLVSGTPDLFSFEVGQFSSDCECEFLLLACDGLWDVMDAEDAVRVTRDLLLEKKWTAQKAAARLAELAIHLGSSDNITVIVIRIYSSKQEDDKSVENR